MPKSQESSGDTINIPWSLKDLWQVIWMVILLIIGVNLLLGFLNFEKIYETTSQKTLLLFFIFMAQEVILLAPLLRVTFNALKERNWKVFGFRWIGFWKTLGWTLRGYGLAIIVNIIIASLIFYAGTELPGFEGQEPFLDFFIPNSAYDFILVALLLAIIAPIVEEVFFRGFILQTLLKYTSPFKASILTAALFAAVHFTFGSVLVIFILGLILNWLFIKTNSLWPSIGFHIINNSIALTIEILIFLGKLEIPDVI